MCFRFLVAPRCRCACSRAPLASGRFFISWSASTFVGITIYFFFYDDSSIVWSTGNDVGAEEQAFLEGLVNAFEHHDHLIWVVAEEYTECFPAQWASNIAAIIRAAADDDHIIAVHQRNGLSFDFPNDPNVDPFAIQYEADARAPRLVAAEIAIGDQSMGIWISRWLAEARVGPLPSSTRAWVTSMLFERLGSMNQQNWVWVK